MSDGEHDVAACNEVDCRYCKDRPSAKDWPGVEGYCPDCHMIVAVEGGLLAKHRGAWALHFNNGDCAGSDTAPTEPDSNVLDPWEATDGKRPKRRRRNDTDAPGQSYGV